MATVYYAKWVLLPSGEILENGAVSVSGGRIAFVGPRGKFVRAAEDRPVMAGDLLLMPGLINMHCHLEEGVVRSYPKDEEETFASWLAKKNSRIRQAGSETLATSIRLGCRELLSNGVTAVVDSSRTGLSAGVLAKEPIRSCILHEVHADDIEQDEAAITVLKERIVRSAGPFRTGIGPYSVFSLSPDRHRDLCALAAHEGYVWAAHLAESAEELQAFSEQAGDLYFHISRKKGWQYGRQTAGSLQYALASGLIPDKPVCFHCNYAGGAELDQLKAKHAFIVQCLQYTSALGHKPFPLDAARLRKIPLCLGSESIVYSESMDLLDELNFAKRQYPHIPAREMIEWVTINPARAIGAESDLGSLEKGKLADMIGVSVRLDKADDLLEQLIMAEAEVRLVMVGGEEVIADY
jgi:5-methylthioadenosine/S-adenosylhomocysteine deaminase